MNKNIITTAFLILLTFGLFALVYMSFQLINTSFYSDEMVQMETDDVVVPEETSLDSIDDYAPPTEPPPAMSDTPPESDTVTPSVGGIREELQRIMSEIEGETVTAATQVSECRLLPLGHSPCGGPSFYHVYAILGSNTSRLEALSRQHQTLAAELNQMTEVMGICMITPEPEILVADGSCVIELN